MGRELTGDRSRSRRSASLRGFLVGYALQHFRVFPWPRNVGGVVTSEPREIGPFLIARGGPFYEMQQRLGLLREHAFRAGPRALFFVFLAWGVPFLLSLLEGHAFGRPEQRPFLLAAA